MKICKCGEKIPGRINIDGKIRNLKGRKFCFNCSPFGCHNTSKNPENTDSPKEDRRRRVNAKKIKKYRHNIKRRLIEFNGGKCMICGYDKDVPMAYVFHHLDPSKKEFGIADSYIVGFKKMKEETKKCQLLCCRCHAEVHHNINQEKIKKPS